MKINQRAPNGLPKNQTPKRQGERWSRYRCNCNATHKVFCLCGDLRLEKVVTFKDLGRRNLAGLFSINSPDRLSVGSNNDWRLSLFQ